MEAANDVGLRIGDAAPPFDLPGVDGVNHTLDEFSDNDVLIVMFTCNHCPYVRANELRLIDIQRDYKDKGVALVGINANETVNYPDDSFDHMVARSKERGFNFPYLRDDSQKVAKAYGAQCTPEMFVFDKDRSLRYRGRVDDNWEQPENVNRRFLREAIDAVLAEEEIQDTWMPAIGCSIKWAR